MFSKIIAQFAPIRPLPRPISESPVPAGFPSPAEDYAGRQLDLNDFIEHPAATFFFRVSGQSMSPGLRDGDLVVVDRAIDPQPGHIVVAVHEGDFTVKRLVRQNQCWLLQADNPAYPSLPCQEDTTIWGVILITMHWPGRLP